MRLLLVRHPAPEIAPGICYGSSDLTVSAEQLAHATRELGATLPAGLPLYTSPLRRCADLAEQLAPALQSPATIMDSRLAELHFGRWEMQHWDNIARDEVDAWAADLVHYQPGGGESVLQMALRVAAFYQHWCAQGEDAIAICHAGTIRLLLACHRGLAPAAMALEAAQQPHQIAYGSSLLLQT